MQKQETALATVWVIVLRLVELHGIDPQQFLAEQGIKPETLRDVRARLPSRLADIAFTKAAGLIPDPAFALRAAQAWHPSNLGTMGYAWLSSRSLHTGLKRMERFSRIIGNRMTYQVIDEPAGLRFIYNHGRGDAAIGHAITDFSLAILTDMCRTNFGSELHLSAVQLRREQPDDPAPWLDFFACPIQFGAAQDSFLLDHETANKPLPSANVPLANTFDAILTEQLATTFETDLLGRCKAHLLRELTSGAPSLNQLATALGMSQRTLLRKLGELSLTYQTMLDEVRHELARRYLDDLEKSVTEIAFLLGFSEQSAFTRAFRRWSGMSPSTYRENAAG